MSSPWHLTRHPPERRPSRNVVLASPGTCCTCCCCLHTIGAATGAIIGSVVSLPYVSPESWPPPASAPSTGVQTALRPGEARHSAEAGDPSPSVVTLWWSLAALCSLVALLIGQNMITGSDFIVGVVVLLLIGMPVGFLASCVLTALAIPMLFTNTAAAYHRLLRIFSLAFVGFLIGSGIMVVIGAALVYR
jgi:hypothetical protein